MRARKLLVFILMVVVFLLQACGPAQISAIQTAIAQTIVSGTGTAIQRTAVQVARQTIEPQQLPELQAHLAPSCDSASLSTYSVVIGDFVWQDLNGNSLQDPDEPGIPGIPVDLWGVGRWASQKLGSTVTDSSGHFYFCFLEPLPPQSAGDNDPMFHFRLQFFAPEGYVWVNAYEGENNDVTNNGIDSKVQDGPDQSTSPGDIDSAGLPFYLHGWTNDGDGFIQGLTGSLLTMDGGLRQEEITQVRITGNVNCRSGPGSEYDVVTSFVEGDKVSVVGVLPGSEYVVVELPDGQTCWLWLKYAEPNDFSNSDLPEVAQPPTPTPHPTETPKPSKTPEPPTPTPTPTSTPKPIG